MLLIGSPGTGKSMLAQAMAELLPLEDLEDVLVIPNINNENQPKIEIVKTYPTYEYLKKNKEFRTYYTPQEAAAINASRINKDLARELPSLLRLGLGRRIATINNMAEGSRQVSPIAVFIMLAVIAVAIWFYLPVEEEGTKIFLIGLLAFLGIIYSFSNAFAGLKKGMSPQEANKPKLIVDNSEKTCSPFVDATGTRAGALLGDVRHDPLQSFYDHTMIFKKEENGYSHISMKNLVDELIIKYPDRIERNDEGYEGLVLPEEEVIYTQGFKDGKIQEVRIHCVNRRKYKGKLHAVGNGKNKILVTPEHKIYVNGNFIEASKMNGNEKIMLTNLKIPIQFYSDDEILEHNGTLYNITTESGNLFANGILASNSGGMGTPAHLRVEAGAIHRANKGVLFIDEIASLKINWQQELLTAMQEKRYSITGQSEMGSGALVKSEPAPTDFVLVAAGNLPDMSAIHPALRSRIRGGGYEVFVEDTMIDNPENEEKLVQFIAQEIVKDKKIPHFSYEAVHEIIEQARKFAGRKHKFTLNLRELGGLVRAAGDVAAEEKASLVEPSHVEKAKAIFKSIEGQLGSKIIEQKKEYQTIITEGRSMGRVNGLAVLGASMAGLVLPIVAEITPAASSSEGKVIATGKLGTIAKEAVENVSAIIKKHIGTDIAKMDIHIQFLQTYEGLEGDSASISTAVAVISAMAEIPVEQSVAMTGSLDVRGGVLPVGGVTSKIEAAIDSGIKKVLVPKSNIEDIYLSKDRAKLIKIIPVSNMVEVLEHSLADCKEKEKLIKKISKQFEK